MEAARGHSVRAPWAAEESGVGPLGTWDAEGDQGLETGGDVPEDSPCRSCDCHIMVSQSTFLCQNYSPSMLDTWELQVFVTRQHQGQRAQTSPCLSLPAGRVSQQEAQGCASPPLCQPLGSRLAHVHAGLSPSAPFRQP